MVHIHWYPGHIAKAERKLKEQLSLVDVVIEVIDARIPLSSQYANLNKLLNEKPRLILLNKADLSDQSENLKWQKYLSKESGFPVILTSAQNSLGTNSIINKAIDLSKPAILALMKKGLLQRPTRILVCGMPNVGKSSIINKLIKKGKTKTGAKAGVTRIQQWVRIHPKIDLLDTPGIIPAKLEDQNEAAKLAFVNSVSENAYDHQEVAKELLTVLSKKYKNELMDYYKIDKDKELSLENVAFSRNFLLSGQKPDIERVSTLILTDFRNAKAGKFTLDEIPQK